MSILFNASCYVLLGAIVGAIFGLLVEIDLKKQEREYKRHREQYAREQRYKGFKY